MNTKLYIGSELADFNETFNVMYSIGDIRDVGFGNNNKSYTLNLPLTKTNKRLLKYINQPDVKSEASATGRLYSGEMLVISGVIIITKISDYYTSILINSDDWIESLAAKKMSDLDLSVYDHTLNHANVEDSWTASYPFYRYPMIDFGALSSSETGTLAKWHPNDFIPMFQVVGLINKIFAPYTISSTFLGINAIKDLYILATEKIINDSHLTKKAAEVRVTNNSDNQNTQSVGPGITLTTTITAITMTFNTVIANEGANFSGGGQYTIPETGTYRLKATIKLSNTAFVGSSFFTPVDESYYIRMIITRDASVIVVTDITSPTFVATELINGPALLLDSGYYHFIAADVVTMELTLLCRATNIDIEDRDVVIGAVSTDTTFLLIWDRACLHSGLTKNISCEELLLNMSQLDFLSAIRDLFNLRFFMDKIHRTIYIEPWDQFLSSTVIDLTDKIDFESIETEIVSKNYSSKILFKWKDDTSDSAYEEYLKWNTSPGTKSLTLNSVYTTPGENKKEHIFSSIITGYNSSIGEYSVPVPRIHSSVISGPPTVFSRKVGFNTRIVEWKGLTSGFNWYYDSELKTTYPKIEGLDWSSLYSSYLIKFFHYIDKGKLFTIRMKNDSTFLNQCLCVLNTAANEGFRPTYCIEINGIKNYFALQKATGDGNKIELELFLKQ